jgi:hypothetical protein
MAQVPSEACVVQRATCKELAVPFFQVMKRKRSVGGRDTGPAEEGRMCAVAAAKKCLRVVTQAKAALHLGQWCTCPKDMRKIFWPVTHVIPQVFRRSLER